MASELLRVRTVAEYFALPWQERTRFGFIYLRPFAMEWDEYSSFAVALRKAFPVQYRVREAYVDCTNFVARWYSEAKYFLRAVFSPCHPLVRKAIPRRWQDLDSVMVDVNFAIIKQFRQEMLDSWVDWEATDEHKAFEAWIIDAVDYIDNHRPGLEALTNDSPAGRYPLTQAERESGDGSADEWRAWSEKMASVENQIAELDAQLLKEMIDKRGFFWT